MSSFFQSFWLSQWSRYITHGNSNPGYPLLFHGDSPLIWIYRLRESFSKKRSHFWLPLLQVYGRSIANVLLLKLIFLFSCCLCSIVFTQTVSNSQGIGTLNSCIFLVASYLTRSLIDAHARLYLARVTMRLESGLTGIIFYRLLSARGFEKPREQKPDENTISVDLHEIPSKIRLEIEEDEDSSSNYNRFKFFKDFLNSSSSGSEHETITYSKSLKYLLADPDVFSMLVGDISAVQLFLNSLIDCILLPVNIWITWKLLSKQVGLIAALPGIVTFLFFFISSFGFQVIGTMYKAPFMEHRDQRLSICHDILGILRIIRIMGAEDLVFEKIMRSRNVETALNRKRLVRTQFGSFLEYHTQRATQLIVFIIFYLFIGTSLDLPAALASIHILHSLASPLRGIPVTFIEGLISLLRIRAFISSHPDNYFEYFAEEDDTSTDCEFSGIIDFSNSKNSNQEGGSKCSNKVMCFKRFCKSPSNMSIDDQYLNNSNGSFIYDCHRIIKSHLCNPENSVNTLGKCVIFTGSSGCGKTSVINSILECKDNDLCYAYSSQTSWIPQGTVRSAILFGKPWNEELYMLVTDICQLQHDFQSWKDGDLRVIDEGGTSLSGGQKTRVALARCLYHQSEAAIFLFDDIFLNLDPNVGSKIFSRLFGFKGFLNSPYSRTILSIDLTSLLYFINSQSENKLTNIQIVHLNNHDIFFSGSLIEYQTLINNNSRPNIGNSFEIGNFVCNNGVDCQSISPACVQRNNFMQENLHESTCNPVVAPNDLNKMNLELHIKSEPKLVDNSDDINEELDVIHRINHQISALQSKNISIESFQSIIGTTPTSSGTCTSPSTLNNKTSLSLAPSKTFYKPVNLPADLILETEISPGKRNTLEIYWWYFSLVGRTWCIVLLISCILKSVFDRYSDTFISYNDSSNNPNFIWIYTFIVLFQGLLCALLFVGEAIGGVKASNIAHNNLIHQILFSPFWLSDSTPTSYLMNRLSTDMLVMDESPLKKIASVIVPLIDFLIQISILSYAVPYSLPIILMVTFMTYKIVCQRYISTYIRAQKVALSVLSPMYGLFSQLINGIVVIHAFNAQRHLLNQFLIQIEHLQRIKLLQHIASQWAAIRLQLYTLPLIIFILFIPVEKNWRYLALLYSLLISDTTSVITYRFASMERDMCSSERIFTLISNGSRQSTGINNNNNSFNGDAKIVIANSTKSSTRGKKEDEFNNQTIYSNNSLTLTLNQNQNQATSGNSNYNIQKRFDSIEIEEINDELFFVIDYRFNNFGKKKTSLEKENMSHKLFNGIFKSDSKRTGVKIVDLMVGYSDIMGTSYSVVLDGINANVQPFEKIGIIGRTGSGKSTLILALLGLVKYTKGQILLDEIPISMLSIKERRRAIGVLPQIPLLLKGWTIRDFLDPYEELTDGEISLGLDECLLDPAFLNEVKNNLYSNAGSLSGSQLRYLSIAKLVIHSKQYRMVLIDEPPPNTNGDQGLQQSISRVLATHFKHCNIFIVAHHAESIKDCDNIWILAQQKIVKSIHPKSIPTQNELAQILTSYE
ncbi:ABC transporter family [Cryptosporidium sp. chipmunk genotype I]|uniref:ABC transporter family n=1 Tax=Cryptosporidium sp. chipmunk genotype I TaxID=1280935 RepID=UPI00351A2CC3|nr:ABC transporter family [Cryptosporidium sp. chipmunk genotype I]